MNRETLSKTVSKSTLAWLLASVLAGGALAACGGSTTGSASDAGAASASSTASQGEHNQADVTFAQSMIPHHAQAVAMAEMVPGHTGNSTLIGLARRIQGAQQPEIDQMTGWLKAWGQPVAPTSTNTMPGMGSGSAPMPGMGPGQGMPGMMSQQDLTGLRQSRGAGFDGMWLRMMIRHHEGAIEMARTELSRGGDADAKALAQKIIDAQQAEVAEMKKMLATS